ncbi:MAG: Chaperone protein ClpB [Microgenomates bacterium OLB23]|nr:MAG: Chaperone protein ClpB [Microgenomates bacterium OLB23]
MDELRKFFRPELINRFDEVIIFEPLKYQHMMQIAELQMKAVRKLLEEQNIGFAWTEEAKKEIVRQGFDPLYGARPLKRTIQKLVENPISTLIIEQKLKESDLVNVDFDGENFVFNIEKVTFVREDELKKQKIRKFECTDSHFAFETEVVDNATVVCPINAAEKVQEIVVAAENEPAQTGEKEEMKEDKKDEAKVRSKTK